jgi:hypothetical protein
MLNEQQSTRSLLRRQLAKLNTGNIKLEVKIEEEE